MWHRPDRVLRQFGMDQPLSTFDMPRSKVMMNLEITQRGTGQPDWVARYPRYLQFCEQRFQETRYTQYSDWDQTQGQAFVTPTQQQSKSFVPPTQQQSQSFVPPTQQQSQSFVPPTQ
ncbi:hypothetical protein LINPERHAP1_LOCUS38926 [Linum perenne]